MNRSEPQKKRARVDDRKVALITGITGQDGSYLADFLLSKGYEVHGIKRRASSHNQSRIDHMFSNPEAWGNGSFHLHYGDLMDASSLMSIIVAVKPTEVYNLGAQSHVKVSFEMPVYTAQVDGIGTLNILEAIRLSGMTETTRFYQASTSEM